MPQRELARARSALFHRHPLLRRRLRQFGQLFEGHFALLKDRHQVFVDTFHCTCSNRGTRRIFDGPPDRPEVRARKKFDGSTAKEMQNYEGCYHDALLLLSSLGHGSHDERLESHRYRARMCWQKRLPLVSSSLRFEFEMRVQRRFLELLSPASCFREK